MSSLFLSRTSGSWLQIGYDAKAQSLNVRTHHSARQEAPMALAQEQVNALFELVGRRWKLHGEDLGLAEVVQMGERLLHPGRTRVVNKHHGPWSADIMRGSERHPRRWGNPSPLKSRHPRDVVECLLAHARHVKASGLLEHIHELRGEVLGCVCKPARCHGDTLARLADAPCPEVELDEILRELEAELETIPKQARLL